MTKSLKQLRFRLQKQTVICLCEKLNHQLSPNTKRNKSLTTDIQILLSLRILAGGIYQRIAADLINVDQSTASRVFSRFLDAITSWRKDYVKFPENLNTVKSGFYEVAQCPGIIGAIDGTHVTIKSPSKTEHSEVFRNRKNNLSINVGLTQHCIMLHHI